MIPRWAGRLWWRHRCPLWTPQATSKVTLTHRTSRTSERFTTTMDTKMWHWWRHWRLPRLLHLFRLNKTTSVVQCISPDLANDCGRLHFVFLGIDLIYGLFIQHIQYFILATNLSVDLANDFSLFFFFFQEEVATLALTYRWRRRVTLKGSIAPHKCHYWVYWPHTWPWYGGWQRPKSRDF